MEAILITTRLYLREMTPDDAGHAFLLNSDPEVLRHTGDGPFASVAEARAFLTNYPDYRVHGMGWWAMVRKTDGQWLGWCGLKRHPDGEVDLGYRLLRGHWGHGYATEAGRACIDLGFGPFALPYIVGRVAAENTASVRVLEKLGMRLWKTGPCGHDPAASIYRLDRPWVRVGPNKTAPHGCGDRGSVYFRCAAGPEVCFGETTSRPGTDQQTTVSRTHEHLRRQRTVHRLRPRSPRTFRTVR
jgi:RimJ/RimL family protein N-acetyltransferase